MLGRVDPAGLAANFCPSVVSLSLLGEYRAWLALNEGLARGILAFTNHDLLFLGSGKLLAAVVDPELIIYVQVMSSLAAGLCQSTHLGRTVSTVVSLSLLGEGKLPPYHPKDPIRAQGLRTS